MKNKEKFDKTVAILVKAYLNGTLAHKLCTACAVGNIVAEIKNTSPIPVIDKNVEFECWDYANGERADWYEVIKDFPLYGSYLYNLGLAQIEATGYTVNEIRKIEYAFEHAPGDPGDSSTGLFIGRCTDPEWMFNGLMAVVEVLAQIHEIDLSEVNEAKALFSKA